MNLNTAELEMIILALDALDKSTEEMIVKNFISDIVLTIEDQLADIKENN